MEILKCAVRKTSATLAAVILLSLMLAAWPEGCAVAQEKDLDDRIQAKEGELQKLRKNIAEQRRKIEEVEKEERSVADYLAKLAKEKRLVGELLEGLEERREMLQQQVEGLRSALETNEKVYRHRLGILSRRLRDMYKDGPRQMWQELLDANDFADLLQRYKFRTLVAERDAALVEDLRERRAEIEGQEAEITELLHEVTIDQREKESELEKLKENEKKRKSTLAKLKTRKEEYKKRVGEMAEAEKDLQGIIEVLEKERLEQARAWEEYGERDFLSLKGGLPRPVEGQLVREFGRFKHPEFGTVTFNTGIDIEARSGSPIRAVARGRIEYASVLPGYGNCIIINHGGGYYTLYAHTYRIFVKHGDQVEGGVVIAEAGVDASGDGGPMHFEIRKSKKALDPADWFGQ